MASRSAAASLFLAGLLAGCGPFAVTTITATPSNQATPTSALPTREIPPTLGVPQHSRSVPYVPADTTGAQLYQGQYFAAWVPHGWQAHENANGQGIDVTGSDEGTDVSFAYVHGGHGATNWRAILTSIARCTQLQNLQTFGTRNLGSMVDNYGTNWSVDAVEFTANYVRYVPQSPYDQCPPGAGPGVAVHGVVTIGVGNYYSSYGNYNSFLASLRMAPQQRWDYLRGVLGAIENSIKIIRIPNSPTPSLNHPNDNPLTDDRSPYWGRAASEERLSRQWEETTGGFVNLQSPSTGQPYREDLSDYWATGPDGPGYYRSVPGGGYELLQPAS